MTKPHRTASPVSRVGLPALLALLLAAAFLVSPVAIAATAPTGSGGVVAGDPSGTGGTDSTADAAPIALDPEQIQAMQDAANEQSQDPGIFQKASDFVTDKAPFFIIGIVVLAAIVAGILILRGRSGGGPSTAQSGLSSAERRRRKRAATQRAREEERLRRRTRQSARGSSASVSGTPRYGADPARAAIEAEKAGAADQQRVAGAVARAGGAVAAPYSPSQTAPAPGVITDQPPVAQPVGGSGAGEPVTASLPLPGATGPAAEPSLEAPGADATVGRSAAAFAAGAGTGVIADRIATSRAEPGAPVSEAQLDAGGTDIPPVSREVAGAPAPVIDDRLRSTLDDLRGVRSVAAPAPEARPAAGSGESFGEPPYSWREESREGSDLSLGLAAVERRLSAERDQRDRTLRDAEERLRRVEQRAEDAERRAAFAERLAQLKVEESEREKRLQDVISGIERAERRADDAESRAREAELSAAAALEGKPAPAARGERPATSASGARPARLGTEARPARSALGDPAGVSAAERRLDRTADTPVGDRDPDRGPASPQPVEEREPSDRTADRPDVPDTGNGSESETAGAVNLNRATFEQLRGLGLSVTQATRVLAYRERFGGYDSFDDLDRVPGFSPETIESMRSRFTV